MGIEYNPKDKYVGKTGKQLTEPEKPMNLKV
jgi:hypothetical protein